ncbi:MAG TPA: TIGR03668 family PPOX class F420-dependent oxidoreductase [Rhizomicrobium sp.]|nr:TIGR03668 family PPOX class F420-dependent oxidoreductase [Rhizomicrobium sp.]
MGRNRKAEPAAMMLSERESAFLLRRKIGHLATADAGGIPSVVPVCFALDADMLYTALDDKPKRTRRPRRIRDLQGNPNAAFVTDHYDEDWSRLGWVMIRGQAAILETGEGFERGCECLRQRYAQYTTMTLCPLIAIRIHGVRSWGNLDE